jgi:hypothetical protein
VLNESQAALAAQQIGSNATGIPVEESAILASLGHFPGAAATGGWNGMRIGNTITRGGYNRGVMGKYAPGLENRAMGGGTIRKFAKNNLNPRSWGRLNDAAQVHGYNGSYTPANMIAGLGGKALNKYAAGLDADSAMGKRFASYGISADDAEPFQAGAYGKFTASNKLYNARGLSKKRFTSVMDYIGKNDSGLMTHIQNIGGTSVDDAFAGARKLGKVESKAMGDFVSMTGSHSATNLVGGYMSASRGAVEAGTKAVAGSAGKTSWLRGVSMAESHLALGGMEHAGGKLIVSETGKRAGVGALKSGLGKAIEAGGAKAGVRFGSAIGMKAVGMAIPGVNVLMAAMMVHDIAQMGMELVKGGADLAKDGIVSMKGSIDKPVMGMGFRDNEIAATSRARGVQAIQNSRLNGRSILGSEAASAFAHYG